MFLLFLFLFLSLFLPSIHPYLHLLRAVSDHLAWIVYTQFMDYVLNKCLAFKQLPICDLHYLIFRSHFSGAFIRAQK